MELLALGGPGPGSSREGLGNATDLSQGWKRGQGLRVREARISVVSGCKAPKLFRSLEEHPRVPQRIAGSVAICQDFVLQVSKHVPTTRGKKDF